MAKLNFYLRVRSNKDLHPIQGRISHQGKQKPISTPYKSSEKGWDKKSGNVTNDPTTREELYKLKDYVELDLIREYQQKYNTRLEPDIDYVMAKIADKLNPSEYSDPDTPITTYINTGQDKDFADFMDQFAEVNQTNFRYDTLQVYISCARYLRYFACKNDMSLDPEYLDNAFFAKFIGFLTTGEVAKGTKFSYRGKQHELPNQKSPMINTTVEKYYTKISSTIKFFDLEDVMKIKKKKVMGGLIVSSPDITEMPFLDYGQLMEVWNFDCSRYLDKVLHYEAARDCFIFCAFTGLRHNELYDLKEHNIHSKSLPSHHYTLSYMPEKNGVGIKKETVFPEICKEIVEKWRGRSFSVKTKPKGSDKYIYYPDAILPVRGSQRFNELLHKMFQDLGWEQMKAKYGDQLNPFNFDKLEPVGFYEWEHKIRFSGKEKVTTKVRRFEHITFHASRHSFAFWLLANNVALESISKLMNHESYETTQKYYAHWRMHELAYKASMQISEQEFMTPLQHIV